MLNLIACIICASGAITQLYFGNSLSFIINSIFALANLHFAIKWIKSFKR